ncbi:MAG: site-specific DNA-methyltransferase [Proteobacteria bacterium]|nr:site-specific DNA-methyltransferase [Pseudomonadota bacterium]
MDDFAPKMADHIELKSVDELIPYSKNARTHSESQVAQIAASIIEFGFTNPVLIDGEKGIIAGHGRLMAAKKLGLKEVPVVVLDHLSETQKKAYIIADNKLAENAGWDEEILASELADLKDENFNLDLIGFEDQELEKIFANLYEKENEQEEEIPEVEEKPISTSGDVWVLGKHKLICGDSTDQKTYQTLLGDELADMLFTDPPYNVNYGSSVKDKIRGNNTKILNDNLGENFGKFLFDFCKNALEVTKGACYVCMSSSELHTLQKAFTDAGGKWSTFIIWAKNHFTMGGSDYQRQYEPILYGWKQNNDHYWCGDRNQGDVWFHNKPNKNDLHPTMKPVELCKHAILNSSKTDDIILDCFGGSGSTLIASEQTNRRCRMIELDQKYVDVIVKRWQNLTNKEAILLETGESFNEILKRENDGKSE